MAANEYYHSNIPSPPSYDQANPARTDHATPSAPGYEFAAPSLSNRDDLSAPYHNRESQHSLTSDHGAYPAAGQIGENDNYAENIPLKAQTQYGNNSEWMQQTQYPPSPGGVEDSRQREQNGRKKGFFQRKHAWVTWTLTLVQVIVFIVELVKSGT